MKFVRRADDAAPVALAAPAVRVVDFAAGPAVPVAREGRVDSKVLAVPEVLRGRVNSGLDPVVKVARAVLAADSVADREVLDNLVLAPAVRLREVPVVRVPKYRAISGPRLHQSW
jgi:hypothetical protein